MYFFCYFKIFSYEKFKTCKSKQHNEPIFFLPSRFYRTLLLALILHPPPLEMIVLISKIPRDGTQGSALPPSLPVATRLSILGAELCPARVGGMWGTAWCSPYGPGLWGPWTPGLHFVARLPGE